MRILCTRSILREARIESRTPLDLCALCVRKHCLMQGKDILVELQRIIRPLLPLTDPREQNAHIDIVRIDGECIRDPVCRTLVISHLEVGMCHVSIALFRRLSLGKGIGKSIDRLCVLSFLQIRMNLLCRNDFLLCHRHRHVFCVHVLRGFSYVFS